MNTPGRCWTFYEAIDVLLTVVCETAAGRYGYYSTPDSQLHNGLNNVDELVHSACLLLTSILAELTTQGSQSQVSGADPRCIPFEV